MWYTTGMEYLDSEKGKCITCGFLSSRPIAPTPALPGYYEFTEQDRKTGEAKLYVESVSRRADAMPVCFRQVAQLESEATTLSSSGQGLTTYQARVEIISKDRNCKDWYPYTPGIEPKEHLNKLEMERLEQQRKEFELKLEESRKKFDLELFAISQRVQENSRLVAERAERFNKRVTFFFIVLALLEVLATLAALAFPDGIPWLAHLFSGSDGTFKWPLPFLPRS